MLVGAKKAKQFLFIGILCVVAFWLGLYAFGTRRPSIPPSRAAGGGENPGQVGLKEINLVQTREGVKLWELKAEAVEYREAEHLVAFKKVTLTYYPKGGQAITLVGNRGNLDTRSKNISIEGEVVVSHPEGYELKVPYLYYRDDLKEISTEGEISFRGPSLSLEGLGMTMNLDSQKLWIRKNVKMTLYPGIVKTG